jgi:4-amino-4-deoxy-L-arabinose transferase-like glycosyltransferase
MGDSKRTIVAERERAIHSRLRFELIVVLFAAAIYAVSCYSPPSLMDDVDAVQAQIARNMLDSGDWVTARLDGIAYLEKSPLKYWLIAVSYKIFGVHDWAARIPLVLATIALCWLTTRIGAWAFSERAGFYAGLVLSTSVGLYLFTRILIPDVILTLTITLAMWSFLRALDPEELHPRAWAYTMAASIGVGLLLKGLIAAVFPVAAAGLYLLVTRQFAKRETWRRLRVFSGLLIVLVIAAPWHVLASISNPPVWDFTMKSEPGKYHGFFWFYFFNEHVFRFLNMRHPRDYNTVPRTLFWLFHLLWLFPWSAFFPALLKLSYRAVDRAGRMRVLALCWAGFILVFFTFSTTQEYYSMPCYPALALLLGCAMASESGLVRAGSKVVCTIALIAGVVICAILMHVWSMPAPGDISNALTQHPEAYTLSLGHVGDLTLSAFAYLRLPLLMAAVAFGVGVAGAWRFRGQFTYLSMGLMMVLFFLAARFALVVFDPYLGSRALAEALNKAPEGRLIVDDQYYTFSSVFFYTNRRALLLNGRVNNLEYGSYAPGAPQVFIDDPEFHRIWQDSQRYYIVAEKPALPRLQALAGPAGFIQVAESGGKYLFTNHADLH